MRIFLIDDGAVAVQRGGETLSLPHLRWDDLFTQDDIDSYLDTALRSATSPRGGRKVAPVVGQEIWAAGVTYYKSRDARMAESEDAGGGSFYDRVYTAERPELFAKGSARTVVAPGDPVRLRSDSKWNVPEPELTLAIDARGRIFGYTIGNDMSSRDIEGENPLYLPQAKTYDGSSSIGPSILLGDLPIDATTEVSMTIERVGSLAFEGSTTLAELKRRPEELVEFLYRHNSFPAGCYLMTGTGIVPPDGFTLQSGDLISITIEPIGTLTNPVA